MHHNQTLWVMSSILEHPTLDHWRRKQGGAGGCSPPERWTQGAAAPLNAGRRGLRPPTNWCEWVSETKCEIKQPAVVHSCMAQKRIESFFASAPRRTATVVQGKLACTAWLLAHAQNEIARHVEAWLVSYLPSYLSRLILRLLPGTSCL